MGKEEILISCVLIMRKIKIHDSISASERFVQHLRIKKKSINVKINSIFTVSLDHPLVVIIRLYFVFCTHEKKRIRHIRCIRCVKAISTRHPARPENLRKCIVYAEPGKGRNPRQSGGTDRLII